jgi:hypothetical protein
MEMACFNLFYKVFKALEYQRKCKVKQDSRAILSIVSLEH